MGCNCKNQTNVESKPKVLQKENGELTFMMQPPPYTREEVQRVKNYMAAYNKTETEKEFMVEFNEKYFGELIVGYCDQTCIKTVNKRLDRATELLNQWEEIKQKEL
jgi:hypothetical protein